ncbi:MAG: hypothetical protein ABW019_00810 [Chitinophagaceae bacterium]
MIVFGTGSFLLQAYDPEALGFQGMQNRGYTIELRQRYAHLFWIPFFSIGTKWVIRQGRQFYQLSPAQEQYLQSLPAPRTKWYAFSGLILLLIALVIFLVAEKRSAANDERAARDYFNAEIKELKNKLNATDTSDYYKVDPESYQHPYVVLKVQEVKADSIVFKKVSTELRSYELVPGKIKELFPAGDGPSATVTLSKQQLQKATERDFHYAGGERGADLFGTGKLYIIKEIVKIPRGL